LPPIGIAGSVEDLAGNQLNSGTKTINTYRISLRSGWNLISLPADASGSLISDVVSNISSNVDKIWHYWGASNDTWSMWADSDDDVLFRLEPGESYWIDMDAADTLIGNYNLMPTGPNSPPTFTLKNQSWNLIGHWHTYNITASTDTYGVFSGFSDVDIGCIYKYTGTGYTDIWSYHKDMEPGQGYWMFLASTVDRVYTP